MIASHVTLKSEFLSREIAFARKKSGYPRTLTSSFAVYLLSLAILRDSTQTQRTHRRASRRPLTFDSLGMWVGTKCRSHCQRVGRRLVMGLRPTRAPAHRYPSVGEYPKARVVRQRFIYDALQMQY